MLHVTREHLSEQTRFRRKVSTWEAQVQYLHSSFRGFSRLWINEIALFCLTSRLKSRENVEHFANKPVVLHPPPTLQTSGLMPHQTH